MSEQTTERAALTEHSVLRRLASPEVEHVEIDGEVVAYDCERNSLHLLDPIGALVWGLLDGVTTLGETGDQLAGAFGRPADEVLLDVCAFAGHLEAIALAERVR